VNYSELVEYLDRNWSKGPDVGTVDYFPFDELQAFLADRGNPQEGLRIVHVTGSKGKGSVATMVAAILREHGLPTGTFTGPHLVSIDERIGRGDGGPIDREELAVRLSELIDASPRREDNLHPIWRLMLVAALEHFRDQGVRHAAIEVGRGGRYDGTNVLEGEVACVTPIGLEHVPRLGRTRAEIAAQKVAIVKPGRLCISAPQPDDVETVLKAGVALAGGRLVRVGHDAAFEVNAIERGGVVASLRTPHQSLPDVKIGLLGRHQAENACVALCAVEALLAADGRHVVPDAVRRALHGVRWPGRLEVLRDAPLLVYDGAHTAESALVLADALRDHFPEVRWGFVVGLLTRRDAAAMLRALAGVGDRVVCVPVPGFEAMDPEEVAQRARTAGLEAEAAESVPEALERLGERPTCVTGSLYLYSQTAED
jgi:dihydrofolate synthase/folylpolyglutamate synthase